MIIGNSVNAQRDGFETQAQPIHAAALLEKDFTIQKENRQFWVSTVAEGQDTLFNLSDEQKLTLQMNSGKALLHHLMVDSASYFFTEAEELINSQSKKLAYLRMEIADAW
ncbi:MAG: hypothetical protein AAFU67_16450, partial [Bacteroidota bacterium]